MGDTRFSSAAKHSPFPVIGYGRLYAEAWRCRCWRWVDNGDITSHKQRKHWRDLPTVHWDTTIYINRVSVVTGQPVIKDAPGSTTVSDPDQCVARRANYRRSHTRRVLRHVTHMNGRSSVIAHDCSIGGTWWRHTSRDAQANSHGCPLMWCEYRETVFRYFLRLMLPEVIIIANKCTNQSVKQLITFSDKHSEKNEKLLLKCTHLRRLLKTFLFAETRRIVTSLF